MSRDRQSNEKRPRLKTLAERDAYYAKLREDRNESAKRKQSDATQKRAPMEKRPSGLPAQSTEGGEEGANWPLRKSSTVAARRTCVRCHASLAANSRGRYCEPCER